MHDDRWLNKWKDEIARSTPSPAILELGCGSGRDTRWLVENGFTDITAADLSREALEECARVAPSARLICHDLGEPLPFADACFDVVLASLCLHYFAWDKTVHILSGIRRCLKPGGLMLCRLNSTRDVNYGAEGHPTIAHHFYRVDGRAKRFFDREEIDALFADGWYRLSMQERAIDRYDKPKVVWEVILRKG